MKAELRCIEHNDFFPGWESFAAAPSTEPWDDYGWFTLTIGPEGDPGTNYFQVLVSTPAAAGRARDKDRYFRGILVDTFEPAVIEQTLRTYVESLHGVDWQDLVDQLRRVMLWEYEGM
jgi:hypothetical protein